MSLYTSIARPPSKRSTGVGQDFPFENPRSLGIFDARHPQNNRNEKKHPNHNRLVGPGFQRYAGKFLDCLYLQNENDEHRRFGLVVRIIHILGFPAFRHVCVVLKESPAAASRCDGFLFFGGTLAWRRVETDASKVPKKPTGETRGSAGVSWECHELHEWEDSNSNGW